MCDVCWESYYAGYMKKSEVWQCVYYVELMRRNRDELRRIPKRDPDDPYFRLEYGEGLLSSVLSADDYKDWYYLQYLPSWRRRVYRLNTAGEGAERSRRESATRGVEDETNGWPKQSLLEDFK